MMIEGIYGIRFSHKDFKIEKNGILYSILFTPIKYKYYIDHDGKLRSKNKKYSGLWTTKKEAIRFINKLLRITNNRK
jgi:hypothetical protein